MNDKDILLRLAGCIYSVHGDNDEKLNIHRVKIIRNENFGITCFIIYSSRAGYIIGRKGLHLDKLRKTIKDKFGDQIGVKLIDCEPIPILSHYQNYNY